MTKTLTPFNDIFNTPMRILPMLLEDTLWTNTHPHGWTTNPDDNTLTYETNYFAGTPKEKLTLTYHNHNNRPTITGTVVEKTQTNKKGQTGETQTTKQHTIHLPRNTEPEEIKTRYQDGLLTIRVDQTAKQTKNTIQLELE